jgi:hypothetical protein
MTVKTGDTLECQEIYYNRCEEYSSTNGVESRHAEPAKIRIIAQNPL